MDSNGDSFSSAGVSESDGTECAETASSVDTVIFPPESDVFTSRRESTSSAGIDSGDRVVSGAIVLLSG